MRRIAGRRPKEWLARPGLPTRYTVRAAARLLGLSPRTITKLIKAKTIRARRQGTWMIPRSEIIRFARLTCSDRPIRLARILETGPGRLIVVSEDAAFRRALARWEPLYASSLFDLGTMLCTVPSWGVVLDLETTGSGWAVDAANRINAVPDRPYLFAVAPQDVRIDTRHWTGVIERPFRVAEINKILSQGE